MSVDRLGGPTQLANVASPPGLDRSPALDLDEMLRPIDPIELDGIGDILSAGGGRARNLTELATAEIVGMGGDRASAMGRTRDAQNMLKSLSDTELAAQIRDPRYGVTGLEATMRALRRIPADDDRAGAFDRLRRTVESTRAFAVPEPVMAALRNPGRIQPQFFRGAMA